MQAWSDWTSWNRIFVTIQFRYDDNKAGGGCIQSREWHLTFTRYTPCLLRMNYSELKRDYL